MQRYTQTIAEAILPILGFYFWDWSWYFILLFYILDALSKEFIINLQSNKIYQTQGGNENKKKWKKSTIKSIIVGVLLLLLLHFLQYLRTPSFSILQEFSDFFYHKEMGIPQGIILFPLVFLNVWMQYKLNFVKLKLHLVLKMSEMWSSHLHYRFFVLGIVALGLGIATIIHLNDSILLWASVILPFVYLQFTKKETLRPA